MCDFVWRGRAIPLWMRSDPAGVQILTPVVNGLRYAVYWRGLGVWEANVHRRFDEM